MIINTGLRTDIPAYYSQWFYNRIREGCVLVRNPYRAGHVIRYELTPDVVDVICFCTKNPEPMLPRLEELNAYRQFWMVTITPYGKDIEPNVPDASAVMDSLLGLSERVGAQRVCWRYDPILITERYTEKFHEEQFARMAEKLAGAVNSCVISFLDLYAKTLRNFPGVRTVPKQTQEYLAGRIADTGRQYGMTVRTCCENAELARFGIDVSGCMTREVIEKAVSCRLQIPASKKNGRAQCTCILESDIGMYNTCGHGCLYCYANYDNATVRSNMKRHDPSSPLLIGSLGPADQVTCAKQISYLDSQLSLFDRFQ